MTVSLSGSHAAKLLGELRALTAGEYEIRGEIGRGGMAVVYLAYDLRLNRKVAIKAMLPDLAFHHGMEERFKREARTAARLDHPNIVVIYSVRDAGDPLFFVMKYVDGAPLDAVLRRHGALPIPVVQGILLQLCAALQYAHDDGVVHRDVKPANILIDSRGNVQVTDFGIAKAVDSIQLTRTGMAIGTPSYMCPEQCTGRPQSAASDQYSVGVVAYELVTGQPPFTGSAVEIQWAHLRDEVPPIAAARPDCPPTLSAVIMRMLAKDPADRWPTLRDAMQSIASANPVDTGAHLSLAELVRTSPPTQPSIAITPVSPVPQNMPPRAAPAAPADAKPAPPPSPVSAPAPPAPAAVTPSSATPASATPAASTPAALVALEVKPKKCSIEVGTTETIRSRVRDAHGREVPETPEWSSSDPKIASVDDAGVITAHAVGHATIAAMFGTLAAMVNVDVIPVTVARVDVEPSIVSVEEHGAVRLTVRAYTAKAKQVVNIPTTFTSADPAVAEFDAAGNVKGVTPGRTTAVVSAGGVDTRLIITVTPSLTRELAAAAAPAPKSKARVGLLVGAAVALVAVVLGSWAVTRKPNAGTQPVASATSAGTVATPSPAATPPASTTAATPVAPPVVAPKAPVPVPADTVVAKLELTDPSPMAIEVGETRMLIAKVTNKRGELLPTARVGWEVSDASIATVDSEGVVIAMTPGRALVTAKIGARTRTIAVDVQSLVGRVAISIARDSLQPGQSVTATAQVFDRRNVAMQQSVTWRSSNPAVASVDEGGVVRASGTGRTMITASAGASVDSAQVVVLTAAAAAAAADAAASTPAPRSPPNDAEAQAVVDSVVVMIERQTLRLTQLTKAAGDPATKFQQFLETNNPSAKAAGTPTATTLGPTSAKVATGVSLAFEKADAKREKTVNLEVVLEAVKGGWAIREVRFPSGFTP